jgi:hypothetical protein
VIAKTGTLVRTDGGASALVGQMNTKSGRVVLFVIFNQRGNVNSFRGNQDAIVTAIQSAYGGAAPFAYQPIQLSMRLATSDYEGRESTWRVRTAQLDQNAAIRSADLEWFDAHYQGYCRLITASYVVPF